MSDLTEQYSSVKIRIAKQDFIPRSQRMIAWVEANADEIDNRPDGNIQFSFSKEHLKIKQELFTNL